MPAYGIEIKVDPSGAVSGAKRVQRELNNTGTAADNIGKLIKRAFGLIGTTYLGANIVRTLANFSQEMSTVKAITGATESQFKALRDAAKELGATTRFSATQAAQGEVELAKAGFKTNEVITILSDTLALAQAANIDLATSASITANTLKTFDIAAVNSGHAVDVLGKASTSANTTVPGIADALRYVGATAAGLGVPLEEVTAAIAAMANKGIDASSAGTALNAIMKELSDPGKELVAQMDAAGVKTSDLSIAQRGLAAVLETVVSSGLSMEEALAQMDVRAARAFGTLKDSIPFVKELTDTLRNSDGAIKQMAATMDDNLKGAMISVRSAAEAVIIAFGDLGTESSLTAGFRGLASALRLMADNIAALTSLLITGAAAWAAYFAAIKIQSFVSAATAAATYAKTILAGNAVILGSTVAEAQKAAALVASRQAEVEATRAALARTQAELSKAVVLQGSTATEFARIAVLKQVAALEAQLAAQTAALSAAQAASAAAAAKSTGILAKLGMVFPGLTVGVRAFTAAIAANPIGAIAVALTVTIGLLYTFRDQITLGGGHLATLADVATVTWDRITSGLSALLGYIETGFRYVSDLAAPVFRPFLEAFESVFGQIDLSLAGFITLWARYMDRMIGTWIAMNKAVIAAWRTFPAALADIGIQAVNGLIKIVETGTNSLLASINKVLAALNLPEIVAVSMATYQNKAEGAAQNFGKAVGDAIKSGYEFSGVTDLVTGIMSEADERAAQRAKKEKEDAQQALFAGVDADLAREFSAIDAAEKALFDGINKRTVVKKSDFDKILERLREEAKILRMTAAEREIQNKILEIEDDLKRKLNKTEKQLVTDQLRENQLLQTRANIMDAILAPITEYKDTQAALNQLLKDGAISAAQYNAALAQTQIVSDLAGLRAELPGTAFGAELQQLQDAQNSRLEIIRQAKEAQLITEQEYLALSLEANKKYNQDVLEAETNRFRGQLQNGQEIFGSLTKIAQSYAGEQSGLYKTLFRASKAFAIADSTVKIIQGISAAAANPWPTNLAAMASVASATAGLVNQIQATDLQGFQNGGDFRVGGAGGTDSQLVAFRATPNETVSVRTPGQANRDQKAAPAQAEQQPFNVVNIVDPGLLDSYMNTAAGERVLVNAIRRNSSQIARYIK